MDTVRETPNASRAAEVLIDVIQESCDMSMRRIRTGNLEKKEVYWWNEDIANARRECVKCRRRLTRARRRGDAEIERIIYKEAKRKLQESIFSSKKRMWQKMCDDLNSDTWGTGYKVVMGKLSSKGATPLMDEAKMTRIVKALFPAHDILERQVIPVDEPNIPLFTTEELMVAASKIKPQKAPGPDGIPPEVIKEIAQRYPELLLHTFNKCLTEGTFPKIWKKQQLVLISKGKGDPNSPSTYRPLCMLDTTGKLLERLIKPRLMNAINAAGGLSNRQHGFRPGRSTIGALRDVSNAFGTAQQITGNFRRKKCVQ